MHLVNDHEILSPGDIDDYLEKTLLPHVRHQYTTSRKLNSTVNQFVKDLVNVVEQKGIQAEVG